MRESIRNAIAESVQDLLDIGVETPFTEHELKVLGIEIPKIEVTPFDIKALRKRLNVSQAVFARMLNVSLSSVRHWEQGNRRPTGATKVLLELLMKSPDLLNYRLCA